MLAKLAGYARLDDISDWARLRAVDLTALFGLPHSTMPHQSTWSRVFGYAADLAELEARLTSFFLAQRQRTELPERGSIVLALDGKTLRGTIPAGQSRGVHLLAAFLPEQGIVLAQAAPERLSPPGGPDFAQALARRFSQGARGHHCSPRQSMLVS